MKEYLVQSREKFEYNTDPRGRCYNGCYASSEWRWGSWGTLGEYNTQEEANQRAAEWRHLNRDVKNRVLEYRSINRNLV